MDVPSRIARAVLLGPSTNVSSKHMFTEIHGRKVVLINGRHYAVDDRNHGIAQRIAMNSRSTGCVAERVQRSARNNQSRGFR